MGYFSENNIRQNCVSSNARRVKNALASSRESTLKVCRGPMRFSFFTLDYSGGLHGRLIINDRETLALYTCAPILSLSHLCPLGITSHTRPLLFLYNNLPSHLLDRAAVVIITHYYFNYFPAVHSHSFTVNVCYTVQERTR